MTIYEPSPAADALVAAWWAAVHRAGEFPQTVGPSLAPLSAFLAHFQPPTVLLYEADADGLWFAAWLEPAMSGAFLGLWVAPHRRRSRAALTAFESVLTMALGRCPVVFGITRQAKLLDAHTRLGYTILGEFPGLFFGETAWLLSLTRADFERATTTRRRRSQAVAVKVAVGVIS